MADTIDVSLNFDISNFRESLTEAKEGVASLQEQLTNIPQENSFLDRGVQRTEDMIALLEEKAKQYEGGNDKSKGRMTSDLQAGLEEVQASLKLFSDGGAFSATLAKQMFANFPTAVQQELTKVTPALVSAIRQSAHEAGDKHGITLDVTELVTDTMMSESVSEIQKKLGKKVSNKDLRAYVQALAPNVTDLAKHGEYAKITGKYGKSADYASLEKVVPQAFAQRAYQTNASGWPVWTPYVRGETSQRFLTQESYNQLSKAISESDAMMRAAEQVPGMIQRDKNNRATLNQTISQDMFETLKEKMWADFANRVSGKASNRIDLYDPDLEAGDQRRLASRAVSGSAGRVLSAMQNVANIEQGDAWTDASWGQGYGTLSKEAKREKEQYGVAVVSAGGLKSGKIDKYVPITESANTRILGLSGHHNEQTDKVVIFSLDGYDREDAQQKAAVQEILSGKPVELPGLPGKKYIAQSVHGTGADTSYKMVEETEYNRVRDQEAPFAAQAGLRGTNYWKGFLPDDYVFTGKDGVAARTNYFKHQDSLSKGWSDSSAIQADLSDKSFGVIDMKSLGSAERKLLDGMGVMMEGILPRGATQARFGVNNKGNLVQLRGRTLGEWAEKLGLAEKDGRFMVPGVDGTMFDASKMHGLIDASQAKNLLAYGSTNEEINKAMTEELRRYGINSMATFEDAETSATSLGSQAAGFLKISPELRAAQAEEYNRRMRLLETETGIRQFILGNPDDPLAKMLEAGDIEVTDSRIRQRVDNELETLTKRASAGEWIDFSGDEIQNQMLSRNFLTALVEAAEPAYKKDENGNVLRDKDDKGIVDETATWQKRIAMLREKMIASGVENAEFYDDEDIAGIFTLDGSDAVVDFTHPDEEHVGMQRSPTAFGEFVYRKNYAKAAKDVYKKMGLSTEGVYTTLEDADTMATADFDGDRIKTVYGQLAEVFRKTKEIQDKRLQDIEGKYAKPVITYDKGDGRSTYVDSPELRMTGVEARIDAVRAMAAGSEMAAKAASNDWVNDNKQVAAMVEGEIAYGAGTDHVKHMTEAELTQVGKGVNYENERKVQNVSKDFSSVFDTSEREEDVKALRKRSIEEDPAAHVYNGLFEASNGVIIDTDKLRGMRLNRTSLPSVYQDSVIGGLAAKLRAGTSAPVLAKTRAMEEAFDQVIGYKDEYGVELGPIAKATLQNVRRMHLENYSGERGMTTKEEETLLKKQLLNAEKEIELEAASLGAKGINGTKGYVRINGEVIPAQKFIDQRKKAAGLSVLREHLSYKGVTETHLANVRADDPTLIDALSLQSTLGLSNTELRDPVKTVKPQLPSKKPEAAAQKPQNVDAPVIVQEKTTPEEMTYSYSMLNSFAETPEQWYNRYVKRNYKDTVTPEQALGTLTHKVAEIYGKDQIAAGGSGGARTGEEYQEIFHKLLSGDETAIKDFGLKKNEIETFAQLRDAIGYDPQTKKIDPLKAGKGIVHTFSGAKAFVKDLPEILKDYEVLGVETTTTPDLGGVGENSGFIDMSLRDKRTGERVSADIKKGLDQKTVKKAFEQQYLYAAKGGTLDSAKNAYKYANGVGTGDRPVDKMLVLGYGTSHSGDVSKYVRETDFDEKKAQEVEATYRELKDQVVAYGHRGFDEEEIAVGTYRLPTSKKKAASKKKRGTTAGKTSQPAVIDSVKIDPDSGRQFAEQVSLQQDISDYHEQLNNLRMTLDSLGYRKEHPSTPNMWRKYQYQLESGYAKQMDMFNAQGLAEDDPRRQQIAAMHQAASEEFDKTLSISAVEDIVSATEDIQKSMSKDSVSGFATKFAKEFDTLTSSVEKARQALVMYAEQTDAIEQEYSQDASQGEKYEGVIKLANEEIAAAEARLGELESKSASESSVDQRAKYAEEISTLKAEIEKNKSIAQLAGEAKDGLNLGEQKKNIESRKEVLSKANEANEKMNAAAMERLAQIREQATSSTDAELQKLQHMADGTGYTPAEVVKMKKEELLKNIEMAKATVNDLVERGAFSEDQGEEYLSKIKTIDPDAYAKKIEQQLQFQKDQEEKSYDYKQQKLARDRDDEIMTTRERNEARREGKPVDKSKHEERVYEARIAELEEQRRVLNDKVLDTSGAVTQQEKDRALEQRQNLDTYIADVKANHDETLRTDAFADVRDFNERLTKENSEHGADSIAVTYAQQFQNLNQQIEEATASYEKLKAKIDSGSYTKEDKEAFGEADAEVKKAEENADEKRNRLSDQFTKDSKEKLKNLQHLATGEDYTPAEIAQMKKESLQEQIAAYVKGQRAIGANENIDNETRVLANIRANKAEAIDLDAYEETMREQLELEQEQKDRQEELRKNRVFRQAEKRSRDPYGRRRNTWWGQVQEQKENAKDQLEDSREQLESEVAKQKSKMSHMKVGTEEYDKAKVSLEELEKHLEETGNAADKLDGPFGTASAAASKLAESAGKIALSFGKQILKAALNEAKQFVTEWNASMTEIQMITGKTNTAINELSANLASTAVDLRVSTSEVGSAAADLYRQGLSDEEVSVRLEDVIKFSKVANITTEQASKILTTAMSNGLVNSTEEAMDAMVALGDSAATTAGEIAKGMQKSAGAAKEAKVSYSELLTMLTIITSKTQLSGSEAGTTMKALFNHLYKVSMGEDYTDENGNRVAATDTTKALQSVGINMFDESGNFRGAYDILVELASGWEGYNDTQRNVILQTLGAGRQSSNVATLLQGLGEDDGELANKYMDLAENSDGVTDEKYQAYYNNLAAAMENVKSSFDQLVEMFDFDDVAIGFLNFIAECIQGVTALGEATEGVLPVILTLGGAIAGFALTGGSPLGALVGLFAGFGVSGLIGSFLPEEQEEVDGLANLKEETAASISKKSETDAFLDRLDELNKKENKTAAETAELEAGLKKLNTQFGVTAGSADGVAASMTDAATAIAKAREEAAKMAAQELRISLKTNANDVYDQVTGQIIDPYSSNNIKIASNIENLGATAEDNGGSIPDYKNYLGDGLLNYLKSVDEDPEIQGLMEKYGLYELGYTKASELIPFLENQDQAWSKLEEAGVVSRVNLMSLNGGKYVNEDGTLNTTQAAEDFIGELYIAMAKKTGDFTAFATENNEAVYKEAIKSAIIWLLAGNSEITDEQIEAYADIYATNAVSKIMANGDVSAQNDAFLSTYLGLSDPSVIVNSDGSYTNVEKYIEENRRSWSYVKQDGSVISGLTKTEALSGAQVEYGSKYTVGDETFGSYADANNYRLGVLETEISEKPITITTKDLLLGWDKDKKEYTGQYKKFWDSLKNPVGFLGLGRESDEDLYTRLSKGSETEYSTSAFFFNGKPYSSRDEANNAYTTFRNKGITVVVLDQNEIKELSDPSVVYETPVDGSSEGDSSSASKSKMSKLMDNLETSRILYESDSNNRVKLSADTAFEAIVSNGITSLEEFGEAIDEGLITTLSDVAENVPEVRKALERAFEVDEDGNWKVREGVGSTDLANIIALIANGSMSYTGYGSMSQSDQMTRQTDFINDALSGKEIDSTASASLVTTLGADLASKIIGASGRVVSFEEYKKNLPKATEEDYQKDAKVVRLSNIEEALSPAELQYVQTLSSNAQYGITGLLDSQKLGYRQDFANALMNHNGQGVAALDESMRSVYTNGDSTSEMLWAASAALGEHGLDFDNLNWWSKGYEEACEVLESLGLTAEQVKKAMSDLNDELGTEAIRNANKYGESTEDVISAMSQWGGTAKKAASGLKTLNSTVVEAQNNQYYRDKYRSGARDDETVKAIAEQTGFDEADVKAGKQSVKDMLDITEAADLEEINDQINALNEFSDQNITLTGPNITMESGSVDIATALSSMTDEVSAELLASYNSLIESGYEVKLETYQKGTAADGSAIFGARIVPISNNIKSIQGKKKSGGGGGGGGGKSAASKLIESQDHETTLREHIIKMIQYEETRYQNADELTNYGIMLQHEIDEEERQTKVIEQNIEALKSQMAQTSKGSDDWYSLREAILKAEESLAEMNNTIEENKKKLKENEQAILKLHTELEQEVKGEIETRISEEKDMLDGQVNMEQTILDAIKNRYEEEWELMQKDIDKKKKALQEEIDLIDERLQRRKDAEDEAEKYEELAEYKRQLALISTDSTRTKDQASLREKIAELEKELAWDEAEEEADLQKEGLQDQIDAYDEYVDDYQEYLDDLLENANNFADEVNSVMQMSHEDMIAWLQKNVEEYTNSLEASQKQMAQGWDDTFKQMKGIIDTFWEEIAQKLSSKESFLEYMKQSSSYQNASEDEKKQMEYNWETMYDSWISAKKVSQEAIDYSHTDETLDGTGATDSGSSSGKYGVSVSANGKMFNSGKIYATKTAALNAGRSWVDRAFASSYTGLDDVRDAKKVGDLDAQVTAAKNRIYVYKKGGMVDYTGPAWVDGTKSRPEAFLSAEDTQMIRTLIDGWKYVATRPTITSIDGLLKDGSSGNTIGDVYVTLNEAQFNTDDDYELVAQKVGEAFTKELAKNGFKTASFAF